MDRAQLPFGILHIHFAAPVRRCSSRL